MSANVGLSTPRGSGTSGYVQRNLSLLKPRDNDHRRGPPDDDFARPPRPRQPDREILEHDRRRAIEVEVFALRDRLEDEGVDEDEIEDRTAALREKLLAEQRGKGGGGGGAANARGLKPHQVHELARAKIEESDRFRRALGIREDYEEGSHWRGAEERLRKAVPEREGVKDEIVKEETVDGERGSRGRSRSPRRAAEKSSRVRSRSRSPARRERGGERVRERSREYRRERSREHRRERSREHRRERSREHSRERGREHRRERSREDRREPRRRRRSYSDSDSDSASD